LSILSISEHEVKFKLTFTIDPFSAILLKVDDIQSGNMDLQEDLVMESVKVSIIMFSMGILALGSVVGCEEETTNTVPVIKSFQADPTSVEPNGQITLTVLAVDAESDPLTYIYQSGGGTITGTGDIVTWTAPKTEGSYVINVEVSDGELSAQSTVTVRCKEKLTTEPIIICSLAN
jgi:hypothetical protein